ncbi:MAG: fused MFS/spermidine synthase, partial [Planctomycetota bacterium]
IYEVVWTRLLRLVMGNTTHTITTVLVAFMGGLALGSYLGGRWAQRRGNPLRLFAAIQAAVAVYCLMLPWLIDATMPVYALLYRGTLGWPTLLAVTRFVVCALLLIVPATLMGATLPVLSRFFVRSRRRVGLSVGTLYAVNTFGAVAGVVGAGFWLIPSLGVRMTIWVACGLSLLAAGVSYLLSRRQGPPAEAGTGQPACENAPAPSPGESCPPTVVAAVLGGYALAGGAAMVCEIAWTRVLSLLVGSSVYAFSMMLTAFILGLALGSAAASRFVDRLVSPLRALACVEVLVGLSTLAVLPFIDHLPFYVTGWLSRTGEALWQWQAMQFAVMLGIMIVPTFLMGTAFPLVNRMVASGNRSVTRSVAAAYSANTLGCLVGSVIGGFVLIPWLGLQGTLCAAVAINVLVGAGLLLVARPARSAGRVVAAGVSVLLTFGVIAWMPTWDAAGMSFGPLVRANRSDPGVARDPEAMRKLAAASTTLYYREGLTATVAVQAYESNRSLIINGKPDASTGSDMPTQELLAHLPMLLHPHPGRVLVIGLASGVTLGSAALHRADAFDCVDLSPEVVEACGFFRAWNYDVLHNPKVSILITDGRNHLALTDRTYDVIISEPPNPWVAGVSDLFTLEFYRACRGRLREGGIVCAYLEAYGVSDRDFRSVLGTFQSVFPNATLWRPSSGGDYLLIGSTGPLSIDHTVLESRMAQPAIAADLRRIGIATMPDLLSTQVMDAGAVARFASGAPIHTDDNALLEFSTPRLLLHNPHAAALAEAIERARSVGLGFLTGTAPKALDQARTQARRANEARGHAMIGVALCNQKRFDAAAVEFRQAACINRND